MAKAVYKRKSSFGTSLGFWRVSHHGKEHVRQVIKALEPELRTI